MSEDKEATNVPPGVVVETAARVYARQHEGYPDGPTIQIAQQLLANIKRKILGDNLGDNTEPAKIAEFENSLGGKAYQAVEGYFGLVSTIEENYSFARDRVVGNAFVLTEQLPISLIRIQLSVAGQYKIIIHEDGRIVIGSPMSGGDDWLMYGTEGQARLDEVEIDPQGQVSTQIQPTTQTKLTAALDTTTDYYHSYQEKLPLMEDFRQSLGTVPEGLFPFFPVEAIRQLRQAPR